ncbi:hypothetical protein PG985_010616 [Apiospora marii]|uniref:uncharacterized protein n=1 Tax=Apiospora marii TaxID=335849 RepID=UPI0031313633
MAEENPTGQRRPWNGLFSKKTGRDEESAESDGPKSSSRYPTWNMGMLNDKQTIEVPGSVLLLAKGHNEPLGLRNAPARTSHSSLPTGVPYEPPPPPPPEDDKKMTKDGQIILEPQPDDSHNDPLNWASWRRDLALLSLGLYCMVGGGITPLIAAGFTNVAEDYNVPVAKVSLTTGLYMMGLGIGSVFFSPTAILYGKRPVYLFSAVIFILSAVWCALSPNFTSLLIARIFQGIAVSPVECLPSATIAEIFFLHERAYRIGIYTLLLLGGKNLIPLVSAVIIQSLGWRWVFWIVAIVVGFCGLLLYVFVPETFWDRTPIPRDRQHKRPSLFSRRSSRHQVPRLSQEYRVRTPGAIDHDPEKAVEKRHEPVGGAESPHPRPKPTQHVGFAAELGDDQHQHHEDAANQGAHGLVVPTTSASQTGSQLQSRQQSVLASRVASGSATPAGADTASEKMSISNMPTTGGQLYTHTLRKSPPKTFAQHLQIYHGRLNPDKWWKAAVRPLILFSYPAVLWSSVVYACSIGWLIVISESVAIIYREGTYKFGALATGLVYLSPFIGGVLGTAVAGRVSDVIVKAMARRNGGLYEPEFRLVMAIPIAITTVIGLMGFGWSAGENDPWIVPTVFFGVVSFGCCLGSTTSITFCVDSYRQYAGEALVTLNFSKNIFHGLVFSLFVTEWLTHDGSKTVFIWIGVIQLITLLSTIPMYIYGKRARMWTVRKNMMEKF